MKRERIVKKSGRAGLNVRFEIMNILHQEPMKTVKLPSAQEFADQFSISRRTVTMELKAMIDEGYLTGVQGVGTFTNPGKNSALEYLPCKRIIGIACRDTQAFYYDYNLWAFQHYPGFSIIPDAGFPHCVTLSSRTDAEMMYRELKALDLGGLIWTIPPEIMHENLRRFHQSGLPVVTVIDEVKGIPAVLVDYVQCGRDIAGLLLKENRHNVLWCAFDKQAELRRKGAEEVFTANGFRQDMNLVVTDNSLFEDKLTQLIKENKLPDAIYLHGQYLYLLLGIFKRYNIDPYDGSCRLIAGWSNVKSEPAFKGIIRKYPYEAIGDTAARLLKKQFSGEIVKNEILKMDVWQVK